jgi:hypothetical protein
MNVAILGCGPAGLMAAHAVYEAGHDVMIYSKFMKSELYGAMYLHREIPAITNGGADFRLQIIKQGTSEGYAEKVYKDREHDVSFDKFKEGFHPAWDLREAYETLWQRYWTTINNVHLDAHFVSWLSMRNDLVISTVPAKILCTDPQHEFEGQPIWVLHGDDPDLLLSEHLMIYNGLDSPAWYRYSQFNTYQSWEYSHKITEGVYRIPPYRITQGIKPIRTDCDCPPDNVYRVGRFGAWEKGCLTHHAYEKTQEVLNALQ